MAKKRKPTPAFLILLIAILLLTSFAAPASSIQASQAVFSPAEQASILLDDLTPEERVGQLFLITFEGTQIAAPSQIEQLIKNHYIGGVVLLAEKDNFTYDQYAPELTITQAITTTRQLQLTKWEASQETHINRSTGEGFSPAYIPLFIGLSQEGDGYPYDQILHGLTPLPNEMALGAAWKPELAAQVGNVLGSELSMLGINLLLGPSLDVLENPQTEGANDLGTRTFSGDPYWVAEMGRAYIRGVHVGSQGRVAVVAKHFPGHGSSDRLPEQEVATVRKSLEELISFDLAPFIAVTGAAPSPEETADALLSSHIRYQGLQGNIRATTRPVSFDPQAFNLLMQIPELDSWRKQGGVMVSDNLSGPAVRSFYSLTSQDFDARRVSLNAFLSGNDLMYLADFSFTSEPDPYQATIRTVDFFAQKYREDTAFAQRVDESVLRILTLKFKLHGDFTLPNVLADANVLADWKPSSQITFDVARQSATLISPTQTELDETIPDPPNQNDRIVFLSDERNAQQCSKCAPYVLVKKNALQEAVIRLYGPQASGQVNSYNLSSYSLTDLEDMLNGRLDIPPIDTDLRRANWIIFTMLQESKTTPSFQTLNRFLSERPDLFQQKRVIVFVLSSPYYLDATNISKLSAYYGLYSKTPQSIDVAAYLLFRELRPTGAPPVSVAGINYDLNKILFPDPDQTIPLMLDLPESDAPAITPTPEATPQLEFGVGDVIPLRTGVIVDHNGHPVPDGTPVNFVFTTSGETNVSIAQVEETKAGVATTTYLVTSPGALEMQAISENANSTSIKVDIPSPNNTKIFTETPIPIEPTPTLTATPTITATPLPESPVELPTEPVGLGLSDWLIALLIACGIAWSSYLLAARIGHVRWGARAGFLALIGGLATYTYMALELPGSQILMQPSIARGVVISSFGGALLGLCLAFIWRMLSNSPGKEPELNDKHYGNRKTN